jgi:hypothetical protein
VKRIDVSQFIQLDDDRHENDDGRDGIHEIADDDEQQHQQEHDDPAVVTRDQFDPAGDDIRTAQIGEHPAESGCGGDQRQRKRIEQASIDEVVGRLGYASD